MARCSACDGELEHAAGYHGTGLCPACATGEHEAAMETPQPIDPDPPLPPGSERWEEFFDGLRPATRDEFGHDTDATQRLDRCRAALYAEMWNAQCVSLRSVYAPTGLAEMYVAEWRRKAGL